MEMLNREQHICMISDDGFVVPTCVAIQSLKNTQTENICVHIIASSLTEESEEKFLLMNGDGIRIDIIRDNAEERFEGYHTFSRKSICCASISALLKFVLPELLPNLDRVLYIDGDIIVKDDLSEIFLTDLGDNYVAAVIDSGTIYYKKPIVDEVQHYFNSGIMYLNLAKMREDGSTKKLCDAKKD